MCTPLKLWLLGLIGSSAISSLLFPENTLASPTAEWTSPWSFVASPVTGSGDASNAANFGNTGFSGQALPGTKAFAGSKSSVNAAFLTPSFASIQVEFNRSFELEGSPSGWSVSLDGTLDGTLSATTRSLNPEARVNALAAISGASIAFDQSVNASTTDPEIIHFSMGKSDESVLQDGDYQVLGSLLTHASVDGSSFSIGSAVADFFSSFSVDVNATPETPPPVPETINLVGAFAVVGFGGYIWFRRSRALRCS
jgi:hypothetical protein